MDKILVMGASGNVGRLILENLLALGVPVRASGRNPAAANFPVEADVVTADITKPETLTAALNEISKVFLYANPEGIDGFVAKAKEAGVKHIVLLSSGAVVSGDENDFVTKRHLIVEQSIIKSGIPYTFLRPGAFASNALIWKNQITHGDIVRFPYPLAEVSPIHESDIAAVATKVLTNPGYEGATPWLTGPESLTQIRQVELIGEAIGRKILFEEIDPDQAFETMSKYLHPQFAQTLIQVLKARNGIAAIVSDSVAKITGRPAKTFADWAMDHKSDFIAK